MICYCFFCFLGSDHVFTCSSAPQVPLTASSVEIPAELVHSFDEAIEEVTYPEGDPDVVTIKKRDIELLEPGKFVNDNIIDFYIKYD